MKPLYRSLDLAREHINEDDRTIELSFSSEQPYERYFGDEILSHEADAVDLRRLQGKAPVLMDHNPTDQVGVVESAEISSDRKGRAVVRFGNSTRAEEIWQDIKDGIRSLVSVGYRINKMVEEDEDVYRVTDWMPFEISIVSVPADATVGIGRGADEKENPVEVESMKPKDKKAPEANPAPTDHELDRARDEARSEELARVREITTLGKKFQMDDMARSYIDDGKSADAMRDAVLAQLEQRGDIVKTPANPDLPMTDEEVGNYSVIRAVRAFIANDWKNAGFEREVNMAMADAMGRDAQGFFVPWQVMSRTLDTTTPTTAAELVGTDHRADLFIELLRPRSIVANLGARMMDGLVGNVDIPSQIGGATFEWLAEGGNVGDSDPQTGNVGLSPKTVAGSVPMTRRLLKQSSPAVERMVLDDLLNGLGLAVDKAAMLGTGTNQPTGIVNTTGVGSVTLLPGVVTRDNIVDLETAVAVANADVGSLAYAFNAGQRGIMKKSKTDAGSGIFLLEGNELNGYSYGVSNQLAADQIIFGNWNDLLMGMWGGIDVKPDEAALAASGGLKLRVFQDVDIAVRHAGSFAVGSV